MLKRLLLFFLLLAVCLSQQALRSGIDRAAMDPTCKPCENFWRYAKGGWVDKNPIPARFPSWGPSRILSASNARLWGTQYRPEYMQTLISTDPHPMPKARANATLQNMPEFHKAFGCKSSNPMVRPPTGNVGSGNAGRQACESTLPYCSTVSSSLDATTS